MSTPLREAPILRHGPHLHGHRWGDPWRAAALLLLAVAVIGAAGTRARAPDTGDIQFTAAQAGTPLRGSFEDFTARVEFDPLHPQSGAVHVQVSVASVSAGSREADALLRSAGFFDAAQFPQASFDAAHFVAQTDGQYLARGSFVLKGHAMEMPVTFAVASDARGRWFNGSFSISRLQFGVGQGEWSDTSTLDDRVEIAFRVLEAPAAR